MKINFLNLKKTMGQEQSKDEKTAHRRVLSNSVVVPIKEDNIKSSLKLEAIYPSSITKSGINLSPRIPRLDQITGYIKGFPFPIIEENEEFDIGYNNGLKELPINKQYSNELPMSSSAPIESLVKPLNNVKSLETLNNQLNSQSKHSSFSSFQESPIVTVKLGPNKNMDPILIKLSGLSKMPDSFQNNDYTSDSPSATLSANSFSLNQLWHRSPAIKIPKVKMPSFDELEIKLFDIIKSYQLEYNFNVQFLLREQNLVLEQIKGIESAVKGHIKYTTPHLLHIHESKLNLKIIMKEMQKEVEMTSELIKNTFKRIEKINSLLPQSERLGYLKYQNIEMYPNLHSAFRKAMLKGSAPKFTKSNYSFISKKRRESVTTLTLDSVLSDKHNRPYTQLSPSFREQELISPTFSLYDRPLSSTSRNSIDEFGYSAQYLLNEMKYQFNHPYNNKNYAPSLRTQSPSIRNIFYENNINNNLNDNLLDKVIIEESK